MSVNIDKSLYNQVVKYKLENEQLIEDLYASFDNFTPEEKHAAIEIIYNVKIINDEYQKYIVIYNNTILEDDQVSEYLTIYGDTFQSIAQFLTGDFNNWKKIMEFNGIKDPYLEVGTTLKIPRDFD